MSISEQQLRAERLSTFRPEGERTPAQPRERSNAGEPGFIPLSGEPLPARRLILRNERWEWNIGRGICSSNLEEGWGEPLESFGEPLPRSRYYR